MDGSMVGLTIDDDDRPRQPRKSELSSMATTNYADTSQYYNNINMHCNIDKTSLLGSMFFLFFSGLCRGMALTTYRKEDPEDKGTETELGYVLLR